MKDKATDIISTVAVCAAALLGGAFLSTASAADTDTFELVEVGSGWDGMVSKALSATQAIAVIFIIFCGFKIFSAWANGSRAGNIDKDSIMNWAVALFIVVAYFAFVAWIKDSITG